VPTPLLPDPLALAIQAVLGQSAITSGPVGTRVGDRIPDEPTWPLIAAGIVDDNEGADPEQGAARVQFNIWGRGPDPSAAEETLAIARTVRSVARDLVGIWPAGRISSCSPGLIVPAPDPVTGRARSIIDLLLETHA
jgi:hypothetical protein